MIAISTKMLKLIIESVNPYVKLLPKFLIHINFTLEEVGFLKGHFLPQVIKLPHSNKVNCTSHI